MAIVKWVLDGHTPVPADDLSAWALWFETADRRVAFDTLENGLEVSTVFLALDHNFSGDGAPLLFETMIFYGWDGGEAQRYATWEEAEAGHHAIVEQARNRRSEPRN